MNLIKKAIESLITRVWYQEGQPSLFLAVLLSPLSALYQAIAESNKRKGLANRKDNLPIKIIVIGNITAGGTGKTPLLIALAQQLAAQGWKPGVISRGHGGLYLKDKNKNGSKNSQKASPTWVNTDSDPFWVGDEPVHIAQALHPMPVIVCPRRIEAVDKLIEETDCDIILSDDGLQHYALARDIEVVLVDAARGFGNQRLLPAGPLREPLERLKSVDMIVFNGQPSSELKSLIAEHRPHNQQAEYSMKMAITGLRNLSDNSLQSAELSYLNRYSVIHLVAGIGHPERFFNAVRLLLSNNENAPRIIEHTFPDHHNYKESDLVFIESDSSNSLDNHMAIVMTAKDAVKCGGFKQNALPLYAIDVSANIDSQMTADLCAQLAS